MQRFEFRLDLSPERYLPYYQGSIRQVLVRCEDGRTVQFPAALLTAGAAVYFLMRALGRLGPSKDPPT